MIFPSKFNRRFLCYSIVFRYTINMKECYVMKRCITQACILKRCIMQAYITKHYIREQCIVQACIIEHATRETKPHDMP